MTSRPTPRRRRVPRARVALGAMRAALPGLLAAWLTASAAAQFTIPTGGGGGSDPVDVSFAAPGAALAPGGRFDVTVTLTVEEPYHVYTHDSEGDEYLIRTRVEGGASDGARWLGTYYPEGGDDLVMAGLGETFQVWSGRVPVRARFEIEADRPPGALSVPISVTYQACDDRGCLLPRYPQETVTVQVAADGAREALGSGGVFVAAAEHGADAVGGGGPGADGGATAPDAATLDQRIERALGAGDLWLFLGLAVVAGFVSLLTPCVFPMIPITVSFFAKRGEAGGGGVRHALAYGGGIMATYTGFGMAMALAFGASSVQDFATNPWVNLAVGGLFVFFGLSLLGFYDLRPPAFLARRAGGAAASRPGYGPVFVMGFVFTVTAFTCTVPIVGALLAQLTGTGRPAFMVAGMLAYSAAFALPFVLLAAFPGALARLPGAGGWMVTVKVMLGFIELIAALKFISTADLVWGLEWLPRPTLLLLAVLLVAAMLLWVLGTYRLPHDAGGRKAWAARGVTALLLLALLAYLSRGLTGAPLDPWTESYLPPAGYGAGDGGHVDPIAWLDTREAGLAEARRSGRDVFLDFTGRSCQNCREVEARIFTRPEFVRAVQDVVPVRLYTDRREARHRAADEANQRLMEADYGSVTLPLYVLLAPDGRVLDKMGYSPDLDLERFLDFLEGPSAP